MSEDFEQAVILSQQMQDIDMNTTPLFAILERLSTSANFSQDTFDKLLAAHLKMVETQKQSAYIRAMNLAQKEIDQVKATGSNPVFNSAYPLLADLDNACRRHYVKYGLTCSFGTILTKTYDPPVPAPQTNEQRIVLRIAHDSTWYEEIHLDVPKDQAKSGATPIQGVGKNVTYARRYLLQMAFNLVPYTANPDDNDGNAIEVISGKQVRQINAACEQLGWTDATLSDLLHGMSKGQVEDVTDIPKKEFIAVMDVLNARINKMKKDTNEASSD